MKLIRPSLIVALVFMAACEPPPPPIPGALTPSGTVLVNVNGQPVTQDMVDAQLKQLPDEVRAQLERSGGTSRIKDNLIAQELLYQEALKRKLQDDPSMAIPLALAERQVMAQALLNKVGEERLTDAAIQQWYNDHAVQFAKPQIDVSHIILADEAKAKEVLAQAQGGADFAELAKANSSDKNTAADGGKLGWLSSRDLREPLRSAVFTANKGDIVGPIQTPMGFHVLKINDKRDQVPFEDVKDQVRSQAQREILQKYVDELEKGANIERKDAATSDAPPSGMPGMPTPGAAPAAPGAAPAAPAAPATPGQGG